MAQQDIAAWAAKVRGWGLLKDRGEGDKDWLHVDAPDGSIFQLRLGNTYTRVVWNATDRPDGRPFAYWKFESQDYPFFPKSDFIGTEVLPEYLAADEVMERLATQRLL